MKNPEMSTEEKIAAMVRSGSYEGPDAYDSLGDGIRYASERYCHEDSEVARALLIQWAHDAQKLNVGLRAWYPSRTQSPLLGLDRSKVAEVMARPIKPESWRLRVRRWLVRKLGGDIE